MQTSCSSAPQLLGVLDCIGFCLGSRNPKVCRVHLRLLQALADSSHLQLASGHAHTIPSNISSNAPHLCGYHQRSAIANNHSQVDCKNSSRKVFVSDLHSIAMAYFGLSDCYRIEQHTRSCDQTFCDHDHDCHHRIRSPDPERWIGTAI